jgi:hypothetical protein
MSYYIKKALPVRAIQWNGPEDNEKVLPAAISEVESMTMSPHRPRMFTIQTLEGVLTIRPGCWIVGPGARGEYWPVQDDIFRETYEPMEWYG